LAKFILDLGLDYTGIDISNSFLNRAIHKYGAQATFLHHDMRQFHLEQCFNFIFIGFNSFLHNLTNEDASRCLQSVHNHLTDNGTFLVSIFIPDPLFLYREEGRLFPATPYFNFDGNRCRIMESNEFDQESQVNSLTWRLERDGELDLDQYTYSMRMFYPHFMDILISSAGLVIKEKFGADYHHLRRYKTKNTSAQEAHEAIRPTDLTKPSIFGLDELSSKLYSLIYKRTLASQMSDAKLQKTKI